MPLRIGTTADGRPFEFPDDAVTQTFAPLAKRELDLAVADAIEFCHRYRGQAQLVVTSPPYNVERDYGHGDVVKDRLPLHEYLRQLRRWMVAMAEALRPGGVLALNLPFSIATKPTEPGKFLKSTRRRREAPIRIRIHEEWSGFPIAAWAELAVIGAGLLPRRSITWVNGAHEGVVIARTLAMGNVANPFMRPASERIILASKGRYYRDGTNGRVHPAKHIEWLKDTWWINPSSGHAGNHASWHPAPFPEELPLRLVSLFTEPGELVIDPFLGSGTSGAVAVALGRRFAGCDVNAEYVRKAGIRIAMGIKASNRVHNGQAVLL